MEASVGRSAARPAVSRACTHQTRVREWRGFHPIPKDLARYTGPCDDCGGGDCAGTPRLWAGYMRAAELSERYGLACGALGENNPHGIDIRCAAPEPGVVWVWEVSRDDDHAVAQARENLANVCATLRARGVDARPGPPFPQPNVAQVWMHGPLVVTRSHPGEPGIELLDAYECRHCKRAGDWLYTGSALRTQQLWDIRERQDLALHDQLPPPERAFGRRAAEDHERSQLLMSFADGAGRRRSTIRRWFEHAIEIADPALLRQLLASGERSGTAHQPAGEIHVRPAPTDGPFRRLDLTPDAWHDFLADLAQGDADPPNAKVTVGRNNEHSWMAAHEGTVSLELAAHQHTRGGLSCVAAVPTFLLADAGQSSRLLTVARALAASGDISHGEIGYAPSHPPVPGVTMLERLLYADPAQTILAARKTLRGYGWLTICSGEVLARLGGIAALQETGAFREASELPSGAGWLLATHRFDDYGPAEAERVFAALSSALPDGTPARVHREEPHLQVPGRA